MSEVKFYNFLGTYNKAYKSKCVGERSFDEFIKNLRKCFTELETIDNTNEELLKGLFNKHLLGDYTTLLNENRIDLSIKKDNKTQVIFEFKSPCNKGEMLQSGNDDINRKALQETIWYFYNQDSKEISYGIKNIVITDMEHLFFFNPKDFCNKDLERICLQFRNGQAAYADTKTLYEQIGAKIKEKDIHFEYAEFNLIQYKSKILDNSLNDNDIRQLKYLYKALHPDFLLREYSPKDSNELNEKFYKELLYILGLKEESQNQKKIIVASDIEGTLRDRISYDLNCNKFDDVINLIIVWLNRILFLKLFESQLISFNNNDKSYAFLNYEKISDFTKLNKLFFNILGKPLDERNEKSEHKIPYLNSSLFERAELEKNYGNISNLDSEITLPLYSDSILSKVKNYPQNPPLLKYLLDFLETYKFSSNLTEDDNKKDIINSAVLGLIFEKLNGYKDGSFFTPAHITEYMAENAITHIVLQKFNEAFGEEKAACTNIEDLKTLISYDVHIKERRDFYNEIIDGLTICDPAVGSGHFLVSVLNYIIALKSELNLLSIPNKIEIQNDSLVIYENDGEIQFEYKRNNHNSLAIQKAVFEEKRKIIENCLFGVDINPNSVEICRLRLWVELLKNTYYIDNTHEMQVLPNIDMNIKPGNSLVSNIQFEVGKPLFTSLDKEITKEIKKYKELVKQYKNSSTKTNKKEINENIKAIYNYFYVSCTQQMQLISDPVIKKILEETGRIAKAKSNAVSGSLEWAIEFPEILDENGIFQGFDIIIGNPPYIRLQKFKGQKVQKLYKDANFEVHDSNGDIYCLFYEKGVSLLKYSGYLCFITSNKWMRAGYGEKLRKFLTTKTNPIQLVDFAGFPVFDTATVDVNILLLQKTQNKHQTVSCTMGKDFSGLDKLSVYISQNSTEQNFDKNSWCILLNPIEQSIKEKIERIGTPLKDWNVNINYGIKTGLNEAFIIDSAKKDELIKKDPKSAEIIRPILRGRDIKRYSYDFADKWLINTHNGSQTMPRVDVNNYPAIKEHLDKYYEKLEKRDDQGDTPYNLRCCAYMDDFSKQKIVWAETIKIYFHGNRNYPRFTLIDHNFYLDKTAFFIPLPTNEDIYILGVLNSKLSEYIIDNGYCNKLGSGSRGLQKNLFEHFPLIERNYTNTNLINNIEDILTKNFLKNGLEDCIQNKIDKLVYQLYGITQEEIQYIESTL